MHGDASATKLPTDAEKSEEKLLITASRQRLGSRSRWDCSLNACFHISDDLFFTSLLWRTKTNEFFLPRTGENHQNHVTFSLVSRAFIVLLLRLHFGMIYSASEFRLSFVFEHKLRFFSLKSVCWSIVCTYSIKRFTLSDGISYLRPANIC